MSAKCPCGFPVGSCAQWETDCYLRLKSLAVSETAPQSDLDRQDAEMSAGFGAALDLTRQAVADQTAAPARERATAHIATPGEIEIELIATKTALAISERRASALEGERNRACQQHESAASKLWDVEQELSALRSDIARHVEIASKEAAARVAAEDCLCDLYPYIDPSALPPKLLTRCIVATAARAPVSSTIRSDSKEAGNG